MKRAAQGVVKEGTHSSFVVALPFLFLDDNLLLATPFI
jgi:hypothetical protein